MNGNVCLVSTVLCIGLIKYIFFLPLGEPLQGSNGVMQKCVLCPLQRAISVPMGFVMWFDTDSFLTGWV